MSEKTPCENCGDPECTCPPGKCDCKPKAEKTQPSNKFLPPDNKEPVPEDAIINKPVNPYERETPYYSTPYAQMKAQADGRRIESLALEPFFSEALDNINCLHAYNAKLAEQDGNIKFYPGSCSVRIAKDGLRDVIYAYARETKVPYQTQSPLGSEPNKFTAFHTSTEHFRVSRHIDDKTAALAAKDFNIALGLQGASPRHPALKQS